MTASSFVHLHLHSHFSLLDGFINIPKACQKAKSLGMPAMAITEHGNMFSAMHLFKAAKEAGIKPIVGMEAYIAPESRKLRSAVSEITGAPIPRYYHIILLVKNEIGYQNLIQLSSQAYLDGLYYKPRIDKDILFKHSEGLICLSACLAGEVPRLIKANKLLEAEQKMKEFKMVFGQDYYFEIMRHGIEDQNIVNEAGIKLARSLDIPIVATNDAHYLNKEDFELHNILLNVQKTGEESTRREYETHEFYLKSPEEMRELFSDIPEAIENTIKIADACNFEYKFDSFHFPKVDLPPNKTEAEHLTDIAWDGFKQRYPNESRDGEVGKRLQFELEVINRMGFPTYFLVVRDFTVHAKDVLDMEVGCARGSVGGSVVAYCLRITEIDPIRYGLMFERFLNPERVSMPDIDMDFPETRRHEVIKYVTEKYGQECVSQITTVNYIKARTAIRDVARVLNVPLDKVDKLAKSIPATCSLKDIQTIEDDDNAVTKELKTQAQTMINSDPELKNVYRLALELEGTPRHVGVHAAGVVIADQAIYNYVPMAKEKDSVTTQFDMNVLESLGLLKMDFLGLRTLDVIRNAVNLVKSRHGIYVDVNNLPMDDEVTCNMLSEGHTKGVFQCDSGGMCKLIKEIAPQNMYDCVPIVALYRPGPLESGMVQTYLECRHGKQEPVSFYPTVEHITKDTYHQLIFQEQIMQLTQVMCGFSVGKADELRKAIGKKDPIKLAKLRKEFVNGAIATNPNDPDVGETADALYSKIEFFGRYCFNKAHSAAYGLIMYQTAYLKAHYPVEYMCALLTSVMGKDKQFIAYLREAKRMGINVTPPNVNKSCAGFSVEGTSSLMFGLVGIKGISDTTVDEIVEARSGSPFEGFYDFLERTKLNSSVIKALIHAGALDCFNAPRRAMAEKINSDILKKVAGQKKEKEIGQISMFDDEGLDCIYGALDMSLKYEEKELLALERELTGVYLSKHPMDRFKESLADITDIQSINKLIDLDNDQPVIVAGIITQIKVTITKKGQAMAFLTLEDKSGDIEVVVFPTVYENYGDTISQDKAVLFEGYLQIEEVENDNEEVTSKAAKMICLGASNLDKLLKSEKRYMPSAAFVNHRKRGYKTQPQRPAKNNANEQPDSQQDQKSLLPRKVRVFLPPTNVPILMEAIKKHYQPGLVGIEVCIGKPNGAGIILELPLQIDLGGMKEIFKVKGLSCKAIY